MKIANIDSRIGGNNVIANNGALTVTYRVDFPGAGSVTFQVLPGATFDLVTLIEGTSINIDAVAPEGIDAVPEINRNA